MNRETRSSLMSRLSAMGSHFSQLKNMYSRTQKITGRAVRKQDTELQRLGLDGPDRRLLSKLESIQYLDTYSNLTESNTKSGKADNIHNRDLSAPSLFHHSNIFRLSQRQIWTSLTRNITRSLGRDL
jgi:hypothetical protein